jgi:hypothetical protein
MTEVASQENSMAEYIIRGEINFEVKIEAEGPEHAKEMFDAICIEEIALSGELWADEPKTEQQIRAEIAELRDGHFGTA